MKPGPEHLPGLYMAKATLTQSPRPGIYSLICQLTALIEQAERQAIAPSTLDAGYFFEVHHR